MVRKPRAFALLLALLMISLVLVVVLGYLGVRALEYSSTARMQQVLLAQGMAEAGMEDARVKLEKDMFFPPLGGYGQTTFTYSDDLTDPASGALAGYYTVTVECSKRESPYCLVRLQSIGAAGQRQDPKARYRIYAEIDVSGVNRASNLAPNPTLYRYFLWREGDVEQPSPTLPLAE